MTDELPTASPGAMATARSIMAMGTMADELIMPDVYAWFGSGSLYGKMP